MRLKSIFASSVFLALSAVPALAHSPLFSCAKDQQGSITCQAAYTDGSSATGATVRIVDMRDRELLSGIVNDDDEYTFQPPAGEYHVVFDGGVNHQVTIYSGDIE